MDIDLDRLAWDYDYWKSVAPEGSTHYVIDLDPCITFPPGFHRQEGNRLIDENGQHWVMNDPQCPLKLIPRPENVEALIEAACEAVAEVLGDTAYDCTRVWRAWSVGTMTQDDFSLISEDDERLAEIVHAAFKVFRGGQ